MTALQYSFWVFEMLPYVNSFIVRIAQLSFFPMELAQEKFPIDLAIY